MQNRFQAALARSVAVILVIFVSFFAFSGEAYANFECRLVSPNNVNDFNTYFGRGTGATQAAAENAAMNDCLTRNSQTNCNFGLPSCKTVAPPPPQVKACIAYEHGWINGVSISMAPGESVDLRNAWLNDKISSTWTAPNCRLAVYKDSGFSVYLMHLGPGENRTLGINDQISSMRCECS